MSSRRGQSVFVPGELLGTASALGIGVAHPGSDDLPLIDATLQIGALAELCGRVLAEEDIFIRGAEIVTVSAKTGEIKPMRPARFCGWIEQHCAIKNGSRDRNSLSRETAALILEQDNFLSQLRKLQAVHLVRLPVRRFDESVQLLEAGYDAESQIFTVETLTYATDVSCSEAVKFIVDMLREYPWADLSNNGAIMENRSVAVQVAAILGVFCRAMFPAGTARPMFLWISNQQGTGKSRLAQMPLYAVFGDAASTDFPDRQEELEKTLATKAVTMAPYIFFDDVQGSLFSAPLNRFLTAPAHSGRIMGGNREEYKLPNVSQVFVAGNGVKLSPDLARRALIVDLFCAGDARGRTFEKNITAGWLASSQMRAQILSALWALVQNWTGDGESGPTHPAPLESFEEWTGVIAEIVKRAGFADPLQPADLPVGGDQESREWRQLLVALADQVCARTQDFTRIEIVQQARELGLLQDLVGCVNDPELSPNENKKLGRRLQYWRGRELIDSSGRRFEFGHRRTNSAKLYPCTILGEVTSAQSDSHEESESLDVSE